MERKERVILKKAKAGSLESNDCMITAEPCEDVEINVESVVKEQYGEQILKVCNEVLRQEGVMSGKFFINDKGALDFTIRARMKAVIERGIKS